MSRARAERRRRERRATEGVAAGPWWRRPEVLLGVIAVALGIMAYLGSLHGPFVYDDRLTVLGNASIRHLGDLRSLVAHDVFRPVVNLSYALDYAAWGFDPYGYHVTNLVLHLLNVLLLMALVRQLALDLADRRGAAGASPDGVANAVGFSAAALLAVHPLTTEAVAYVSGRSELLATAFVLLSVLLLRRALLGGPRWTAVVGLAAFALGALSKESAAMVPFVLLAADRMLLPGEEGDRRRRLRRWHLPFAGLVVIAGLARVAIWVRVEHGGGALRLWQHALTEVGVVWRYIGLLLLPIGQSIMHPVATVTRLGDPAALAALAGLVLVIAAFVMLAQRQPLVVFGLVWFLLLLAPAHVIPLQEAMAEHRVYAASCGFFLAAAVGLVALARRLAGARRPLPAVLAAIIVPLLAVLMAGTVLRCRVWSDEVALWGDAARKAPQTWGAQYAWADALRAAGRCGDAVPVYRHAIELLPDQVAAHLNLGICLAELGRFDEAWQSLTTARRLAPEDPKPATNLGTLAARLGRFDEARASFRAAIALDGRAVAPRLLLAQLAEAALDDPATALEMCREVLTLAPATPGVRECVARNEERLRTVSLAAPEP